jgi:hypothetical protein
MDAKPLTDPVNEADGSVENVARIDCSAIYITSTPEPSQDSCEIDHILVNLLFFHYFMAKYHEEIWFRL